MTVGLVILFAVPIATVLLSIIGMEHDWYVYLSVGATAVMVSAAFVNSIFD